MEYNLTQIAGARKLNTVCISTKVDLKKGKRVYTIYNIYNKQVTK